MALYDESGNTDVYPSTAVKNNNHFLEQNNFLSFGP